LNIGWTDGYYYKPVIEFTVNSSEPFNPQTGQPNGENKVRRPDKVNTIFVPEEPKARRKLYESILEDSDTLPQELVLNYRQSDGSHGGDFMFEQFCDLPFKALAEVQKNRFYTNSRGNLRTKEGAIAEYNRANKKIEAIA
jgi:hypothetical protein